MPLITCPDCQTEISDTASTCIKCGRPMGDDPDKDRKGFRKGEKVQKVEVSSSNINISMLVGIIGLLMIIVGPFLTVASAPIVGGIDYVGQGNSDGVIVVALGVIAFILFLFKKYRLTILADFIIIGIAGFDLIKLSDLTNEAVYLGPNLSQSLGISIGPALPLVLIGAVLNACAMYIHWKNVEPKLYSWEKDTGISRYKDKE